MDHLAAVKKAEQELAQAHLILDLDTIERLLHPDYVIVQPGGRIETKAEALARTGSGIAASAISKMNIKVTKGRLGFTQDSNTSQGTIFSKSSMESARE